jgi:hypothetical protein
MPNQSKPENDKPKTTTTRKVAETRLPSAGEVVVEHHDTPPPGPPEKQIHPRRPLPLVPEARPKPPASETETKNDDDSDEGTHEP